MKPFPPFISLFKKIPLLLEEEALVCRLGRVPPYPEVNDVAHK